MGALPKRKLSKRRTKTRKHARTNRTIKRINLSICPNCGSKKLSHFRCNECKMYKGEYIKD